MIDFIFKIFIYLFLGFLVYINFRNYNNISKVNITKVLMIKLIIISSLYGCYSIIAGSIPYGHDRKNYAYFFSKEVYSDIVKKNSIGLYYFEKILHYFTYNEIYLFFFITFFCVFLSLIAYLYYPKRNVESLICFIFSKSFLFFFYAYKQALAISFISISIVAYFKNKRIITIFFLMLGILSHESALILVPILLILNFSKYKNFRKVLYIMLVLILFFLPIINKIISFIIVYIPILRGQLLPYLSINNKLITNNNILTVLKGIPYYFILIIVLSERNDLKNKIEEYDKKLIIIIVISFFMLFSFYMYWSFRFSLYFYLPVFIFISQIKKITRKKLIKLLINISMISSVIITLRELVLIFFKYGGF